MWGRAYSCWMLNCWCITGPVRFKRLTLSSKRHGYHLYHILSQSDEKCRKRDGVGEGRNFTQTQKRSTPFTWPNFIKIINAQYQSKWITLFAMFYANCNEDLRSTDTVETSFTVESWNANFKNRSASNLQGGEKPSCDLQDYDIAHSCYAMWIRVFRTGTLPPRQRFNKFWYWLRTSRCVIL